MKTVEIMFNPQYDLNEAGHCVCAECVLEFTRRLLAAAPEVGAVHGVDIIVASSSEAACHTEGEAALWQELHDAAAWTTDDRPAGCETLGPRWDAGDWIASDIGSAVDSAGRALADGLTLAQWAQAETDGASCHAVVDPYDLREALLTAVRERPEWLLGKDGRTPIDGAALLAADAGVDIPTV